MTPTPTRYRPRTQLKTLLRSTVPDPVIESLKAGRELKAVRLAVEMATLGRVPRARVAVSPIRRNLDLQRALNEQTGEQWEHVLRQIEASGLDHNLDGVNPGDRRAISALVTHLRPQRVLEVGTHIGSSTLTLAATLAGSGARITTVDVVDVNDPARRHWEQFDAPYRPAEIVEGLAPVQFVVSDSLTYLKTSPDSFDFIFLDGNHEGRTVYREIPLALLHLAPQGVILLHDYFPHGLPLWDEGNVILGPYLALRRLSREGWSIRVQPLGNLPWPTKLGSHATSLALILGR